MDLRRARSRPDAAWPEVRYGPLAKAFRRVSAPPFDYGERDYLAFADDGSTRHRLLIDHWGGPLCVQIGALILAMAALSPGSPPEATVGYLVGGGAIGVGVALMVWGGAIPLRIMDSTAIGGAGLIVILGLEGGDLVQAVPAVAVVVGTAFFAQRSLRMSVLISIWLGVGYAVVLIERDLGPSPVSRWVIVMVAVVSTGAFVRWIRRQVIDVVTAELAARERAEEAGADLARVSRDQSRFVARMSHELRTPLNAVLGFADVLLERMAGPLTDQQAEYLGDVKDAGLHLVELVDEVLDIAVVEAGRSELVWAPLDMADAVDDCCRLVRERAARQGVTLDVRVADDIPTIEADGRKVRQVLLNLLANAVRFTPAGGRVDVRSWADGTDVLVAVSDTGIGIAREHQARMFDRFEQVDSSSGGTGLGLSLARRFLEQHGGRITVDSEAGQGATFTFSLPVHRAVPAAEPGGPSRSAPTPPHRADADGEGDLYDALVIPGSPANRVLVGMIGRWMGLSAAALCLVLALITPGDVGVRAAVVVLAFGAGVISLVLGRYTAAVPVTGLGLLGIAGTTALTFLVHAGGSFADLIALGYGWIIITAFAPWALGKGYVQVACVGIAYAVALAVDAGPGSEVQRWLAVVGVLVVNGFTVRSLVGKLQLVVFAERAARRISEDIEAELVAATAHKDDFVASMSHELRTPLHAIIGFSEVIRDGQAGPLNDVQREYVGDVIGGGRRLLALIDDILDLAKVEAGGGQLTRELTAVDDLVVRAIDPHTAAARARGIVLRPPFRPSSVVALVDPPLLEQAISNVVGNAVKFSHPGSEVTVEVVAIAGAVVTAVTDDGPGITAADRDRVFEAFYTTLEGTGHGLGLAISRRIVELHGGSITVEARPSGGTTFVITVPLGVDSVVETAAQ